MPRPSRAGLIWLYGARPHRARGRLTHVAAGWRRRRSPRRISRGGCSPSASSVAERLRRPPRVPPQRAHVLARRPAVRARAGLRERQRLPDRRADRQRRRLRRAAPAAADQDRLQRSRSSGSPSVAIVHRRTLIAGRRRARPADLDRPLRRHARVRRGHGRSRIVGAIAITEGGMTRSMLRQMFGIDALVTPPTRASRSPRRSSSPPTRARCRAARARARPSSSSIAPTSPSASATSAWSSSTRPTARCRARPRSPRRSRACSRARWTPSAPRSPRSSSSAPTARRCAPRSARATTAR